MQPVLLNRQHKTQRWRFSFFGAYDRHAIATTYMDFILLPFNLIRYHAVSRYAFIGHRQAHHRDYPKKHATLSDTLINVFVSQRLRFGLSCLFYANSSRRERPRLHEYLHDS